MARIQQLLCCYIYISHIFDQKLVPTRSDRIETNQPSTYIILPPFRAM